MKDERKNLRVGGDLHLKSLGMLGLPAFFPPGWKPGLYGSQDGRRHLV